MSRRQSRGKMVLSDPPKGPPMAAHKQRNGALIIAYSCKLGEHGAACDQFVAEMGDVVVCHCGCHQPCTRPACATPRAQRRQTGRTCPRCFVVLPVSGTCGTCDEPAGPDTPATPRTCGCSPSCDRPTRGKFAPGHDAKLVARLVDDLVRRRTTRQQAREEIERAGGSPRLVAKMDKAADRLGLAET